jgi:peptide/nickel transport system permease protein
MTTQQRTSELEVDSYGERLASFGRKLLSNRNAVLGLVLLVPIILMSVFAPLITPHDPTTTNSADKFEGPSGEYLLGTDNFGRDLLSRVMIGGRTTLYLGLTAVALALVLGVPVGLAAGYLGGRIDEVLMRAMDILMSIPSLLLALLIVSMLAANITNAVLAIGVVYAPRIARIVRGSTLSVKNEEFVAAAEARGESDFYIMFGEILPNIVSPIIVEASIRIGFAIIIGTSLSFLGLGTQPPQADWGFMIAQARSYIFNTVWFLLWPSLLLGATVLGFNLLGDGLRDVLDPRVTGDDL